MNAKLNDLSDLGKLFGGGDGDAGDGDGDASAGKDDGRNRNTRGQDSNTRAQDRATALAKLHVQLEKKGRKGKGVTVIKGFFHTKNDLQDFARELKARCGAGGTVKDDTIEIQGDHRKTAADYFRAKGFRVTGG